MELLEYLYVKLFYRSSRVKQAGESYSAIVWTLPVWTIFEASSKYIDPSNVNEAECEFTLLSFNLFQPLERR